MKELIKTIELPKVRTERALMRAVWEEYPDAEIIFMKVKVTPEEPYNVEVSGGNVYGNGFGKDEIHALIDVITNLNKRDSK